MDVQSEFLEVLMFILDHDRRVRAAWLEGSFGRGNADRYSDVDLHLLLAESALEDFRHGAETWLGAIRPLALFNVMFDGRMLNALTTDGMRLDVWLHTEGAQELDAVRTRVLLDRDGDLRFGARPAATSAEATAVQLTTQIKEFWRCISLLPTVIGRGEWIAAFLGLGVEVNLVVDVVVTGHGIPREAGIKRLNESLPPPLRTEIEAALALQGLTADGLARAHLSLAGLMRLEGRAVAESNGFAYPSELEAASLAYVERELALLDLQDTMNVLIRDWA